ncbi:hypothetical protein VNO78_33477 [Psophocarpus tetragonolobus]|uniref:Protein DETOXIFICATION n=1 Tax=Psophocarpus tetragonolobus TaxID=3891 RepID=A0AAN9RS95_PSOTE
MILVEMENETKKHLLKKPTNSEESFDEEQKSLRERIWMENKKMWVVAGPAIFSRFSTFGISIISQAFIGHIGSIELAAYAIVMIVLVRFASGILLGMASALETLCGQAYGAKQYEMLGVYLQRSWIVLTLTTILILPIYIFTTPILVALGQDEHIAEAAGNISAWSIGVISAFVVSFTSQMFLQAQSKNLIIAYLAAATVAIHLFLSWLLTVKFKFGINGAMTSTILAYWLPNFGQIWFIIYKCPETWKGFSFLAFKDLWTVVKLSLASGGMLCLEVWYTTVLVLLTGNSENAQVSVDALSICININGCELMIALGFYAAASVRVSNELGRGSSKATKFSIIVTVLTSLAIGFVFFFVFLFLKEKLAYIFTQDPHVTEAVGDLSTLLAVSVLLNSVQPVLCGVAIGAGWQSIVAYVNLACYYLIGVPVGVVIGVYFHLEAKGIWIGMQFGIFVQTLVLIIITYRTDWDTQVEKAQNLIGKWTVEETQESHSNGTGL